MEVLNLEENKLQAPILNAFQNMSSIAEIDFSFNNLSSTPFWLGTCSNLVYLSVENNALYGSLPSTLQTGEGFYYSKLDYKHVFCHATHGYNNIL